MVRKVELDLIPESVPQTVLSSASLGGTPKPPKFKRMVYKGIKKLKYPKPNMVGREVVVKPTLSWYPSKGKRFIFDSEWDAEPEDISRLCLSVWNPSVWVTEENEWVLVVPKNHGQKVHNHLYAKGFWFSKTTNRWRRRRCYRLCTQHPNALRFIRIATKKFSKKIQTPWVERYKEECAKTWSSKDSKMMWPDSQSGTTKFLLS